MSSFAAMYAPLLFGFALYLSSALLFMVQPMIGRMILPHLGGNPIAWSACIVFFQASLLAGCLHANLLHRFRGLRWQPWAHFAMLIVAVILLFAGVFGEALLGAWAPRLTSLEAWPVLSVVSLLIVVMGLPCLALTAIVPLVQRWFAHLDHPKGSDPYFLFVASNLGGLTALIVHAVMVEPMAPQYAQWLAWKLAVTSVGFMLLVVALCAWRSPRSVELEPVPHSDNPDAALAPKLVGRGEATWGRRLYWLFAAALPIGLTMGLTDYLTREVAASTIVWLAPVALYLIALSQAFARFAPLEFAGSTVRMILHGVFGVMAVGVTLVVWLILWSIGTPRPSDEVAIVFLSGILVLMLMVAPSAWLWVTQPISALALVLVQAHVFKRSGISPTLLLFYFSCYYLSVRLCLERLGQDRPAAPALTAYYTWIGLGGLCGALFQIAVAPLLFQRDYLEYAFLTALASTLRGGFVPHGLSDWLLCMLLFRKNEQPSSGPRWVAFGFDLAIPILFAMVVGGLLLLRSEVGAVGFVPGRGPLIHEAMTLLADFPLLIALALALALFVRPMRFGLVLTAIVALSWIGQDSRRGSDKTIAQQRSAFSTLRVTEKTVDIDVSNRDDWQGQAVPKQFTQRTLMQSGTAHGICVTEPPDMRRYPTGIYHRKGPVGQIMRNLEWFPEQPAELRHGKVDFWLQRNRDNAKDDVRIAASLVGMSASPFALEPMSAAWSEPPFAFVGLGTGTPFTYAHPFQWVEAYELDPAVIDLSEKTPPTFHYYQSALKRGVNARIIPGDARRSLAKPGREGFYHVIFIDAPDGKAIPMHLLTQQAIELYFHKLAPNGVVCIRTSSGVGSPVDLPTALDNIARKLNLAAVTIPPAGSHADGSDPTFQTSRWQLLARTGGTLQPWVGADRIILLAEGNEPRSNTKAVWTDEHANLLAAARPGSAWAPLLYVVLILVLFFGIFLGLIEITYAMWSRRPLENQPKS